MKRKELIDALYHAEAWLYWDCTSKEMERDINKRMGEEEHLDFTFDSCAAGVTHVEERKDSDGTLVRMTYIVWFSKMNRVQKLYSLVHEADHLVSRIFHHRGIRIVPIECEEHHAYYLESWFKRIWREIG